MTPSYIWHVGLGIGQGTRETRNHLTDADLDRYGDHLRRAIVTRTGEPIPAHPHYVFAPQVIGGVLIGTVGHLPSKDSLCTFAVVTNPKQRTKAWQALHEGYPQFAESRGDVPQVPYCAVRSEWGMVNHLEAGAWIDAYQIAVAWAWIDGRAQGQL